MTKEENEKRLAYLKGIVSRLPEKPGSYQYYDENHTIIYVGKAKNLKSRVSSYFHTEVDRFKTKVLVSKIHDISYTVEYNKSTIAKSLWHLQASLNFSISSSDMVSLTCLLVLIL